MKNPRLQNVIREIKRRARKQKYGNRTEALERLNWHLHISTENNFPTAAGLASSAAGYACLVYTLAKLYKVKDDISELARQGSGSACRSVLGGFVVWNKGENNDGSDSIAKQIQPETHWPELQILVLVVSDQKKHTASTQGMQTTVETSQLLMQRIQGIPDKQEQITKAIHDRDFTMFATITMKDSNQMHACCLDTFPPISYMTDTSHQIVRLVHWYNSRCNQTKVAYTFDAGPNACLFLLKKDLPHFFALVQYIFKPDQSTETFVQGLPIENLDTNQMDEITCDVPFSPSPGSIKYVIHTTPGPGPQVLSEEDSILDNGLPRLPT